MTEMQMTLLIVGGTLGLFGFVVSLICVAIVAGFVRSTHTVQYLPVDNKEVESILGPSEDIAAMNERLLLEKVGKKRSELAVADLDKPIDEISHSDINF